ncbi:MAG: flavodoxin family protein [Candidatus Lokiarchaeota archaeon]
MKILILFYSHTGNTEKVAQTIKESLIDEYANINVETKKIEKLENLDLSKYDLVFFGSGIYASRVSSDLVNLLEKVTYFPKNSAYFCTHASLDLYQKPFTKINEILEENDSNVLGLFECVGENLGISQERQLKMLDRLSVKEKEKALETKKLIKGRPNQDDLQKAKRFALDMISKLV